MLDGVAFYAYAHPQTGSEPVYQYHDVQTAYILGL